MSRRTSIILAAAIAAAASLPAGAAERGVMLGIAPLYEDHEWTCTDTNHWGVGCPTSYESDWCPGTYVGLPYDWGGWSTVDEFDADIAAGLGAGSHSSDGSLACTTGVDCSGYVSLLWETPWKYGTSTLPDISDAIDARDMWPGDVYNDAGSHVIMWVGKDTAGDAVITESSGTCNGVCGRSVAWSYFGSYTPRVAWTEYVQTATVGTAAGTADDPIVIDAIPFRDWRNTRYAESDIFDFYSAAPDVDESGPESIYEVALPSAGTLTASVLDAPGADVDLQLLSALDADACLGRANIDLEVAIAAAGTYYLTVDSWVGSDATVYSGAYVLDVDFAAAPDGDADTDTDADADGGPDSGPDTDTDTDSDSDSDSDSDADGSSGSDGGCGCAAAGVSPASGLLALVLFSFT